MKIEDYGLIGDLRTTALVGRDGSIDWLCLPVTDSAACFAALLGSEPNGRWLLAPSGHARRVSRRYRENTLVLETDFHTDSGAVRVIDFMPLRDRETPQLIRIVEGLAGNVPMQMRLLPRFDYGSLAPWLEPCPDGIIALAGPERTASFDVDRGRLRGRRSAGGVRHQRGRARALLARLVSVVCRRADGRATRTPRSPAPRHGGASGRRAAAMAVPDATRSCDR